MTPDEIRYRLEALRWYPVHISILKEKIADYDRQIQISREHGEDYIIDAINQMKDFTAQNLGQTILAQETTLQFIKRYADNEGDYNLLIRHFHEGATYSQMADEMHYCERTITMKVTKAFKLLTENAKVIEPFLY